MTARPYLPGGAGGSDQAPLPISTRTDETGQFRVHDVPPGEYFLWARRPGYVEQALAQLTPASPARRVVVGSGAVAGPFEFPLVRGAVIAGRVFDEFGEPVERANVQLARRRRSGAEWRLQLAGPTTVTNDLGEYRLFDVTPGEYLVAVVPPRTFTSMHASSPLEGQRSELPTYAPSALSPTEAEVVRVAAGEEAGADVQLMSGATVTVTGVVVDSRGQPATDGHVRLHAPSALRGLAEASASVHRDGTFLLGGVVPGVYTLLVQGLSPVTQAQRGRAQARSEVGVLPLEVASENITGLVVRTQTASRLSGRLLIEGDAAAVAGREIRVIAVPLRVEDGMGMPAHATVERTLRFSLEGVRGLAMLRVQNVPDGWWTKAVRIGGTDVTDGYDFGHGASFEDVTMVVSTKRTFVQGAVTLPSGGAGSDAVIILFPTDQERWGRMGSAMGTVVVRALEDGSFWTPGIRPGSYHVIAIAGTALRSGALVDSEYLRHLVPRATLVDLREGQSPNVALTQQEAGPP